MDMFHNVMEIGAQITFAILCLYAFFKFIDLSDDSGGCSRHDNRERYEKARVSGEPIDHDRVYNMRDHGIRFAGKEDEED
jgi:hypothetical protein